MIFSPNTIRNSAFAEPFLKQYRKQKLNLLSSTYWLDEVGDYSGTQREKYVLESDGTAVINSSHITNQTVVTKKGTATATVSTGEIAIGSGWISEIVLSDGTVYFLEESSGTIFYDSSGNGNNATLTGTGTWAIKRDLTLINNANKNGYTNASSLDIITNGDFSNGANNWTVNTAAGWTIANGMATRVNTGISGGIEQLGLIDFGDSYKLTVSYTENLSGNNLIVFVGQGAQNIGIIDGDATESGTIVFYFTSTVAGNNNKLLFNATGNWRGNITNVKLTNIKTIIIPRDESDITKDVLGGNLQFVGRVASDMKFVQSNRGEVGATSDYGQFNFDCTGVTVVSKEGQTTVNINQSNNRLIFTGIGNGSIYHINLSNGLTFPIAEGSGSISYAVNDSTKTLTWVGNFDWSTQDTYHHNLTQGFSLVGSVKVPYKINGIFSNAATNGHNQAETKFKQVTFREDFGASSLHFDQSNLSSKVITYADIANTANVFVNQFPNVKINLETFFPSGIINQSNRQNNGLRRNKDTFFGNNK